MSRVTLPDPPQELKNLSRSLCARIRQQLAEDDFIPFSQFMEMALYEPGLGYYSAGLHKLGAEGDFVTAPELGSLFAQCLARQVEQAGQELGEYDVLELGAGSGKMAVDLLRHIDPANSPQRYLVLERSADLRAVQQQSIADEIPEWLSRVQWLDAPPDEEWNGVLLANEVIDALAVERFRLGHGPTPGSIEQIGIRLNKDEATGGAGFDWAYRDAGDALKSAVERLCLENMDPGYESEILPGLPAWVDAVSRQMKRGVALFIDYGYPRREYYLPERNQGTLMCNYRHRAHPDVFFWPGLQDITAFVDFTALAEAGQACGLELSGYTSQAMFLLACGLDEILQEAVPSATDGGLALNAEAKQLTLPGMMGERFQVMALSRGLDLDLRGFALRDLSYRL
jgi:SAM-dependent MidA family methyltransferase